MGKSEKEKQWLSPLVNQLVSPGDVVMELPDTSHQVVRLGGGLQQTGEIVISTRAGMLRCAQPDRYWVEGSQKRYIPQVDDSVIGIVTNRMGESFEVDINGPSRATLAMTSFEGATRRNRPNVKIGALVYARVISSDRDLDPELSCVDAHGKSSGFGALTEGYMFSCTTGLARVLLSSPPCPILVALGGHLSFEIAVGLNGRAWVNSPEPTTTILVSNAILNSEFITAKQAEIMVNTLLSHVVR